MHFISKASQDHNKTNSSMDQPVFIISTEIVSPQTLSLITKTQISGLDAFNVGSSFGQRRLVVSDVELEAFPLEPFPEGW